MGTHRRAVTSVITALMAILPTQAICASPRCSDEPPQKGSGGGPDGTLLVSGVIGSNAFSSDAEIAVGPSSILIVSNTDVRLLNKSSPGTEIDAADLDGEIFTRHPSWPDPAIVDPDVLFDQRDERFIMIAVERDIFDIGCFLTQCSGGSPPCQSPCQVSRNRLHIAMSTSSTPGNLITSGMGAAWTKITIDIQDSGHASAFAGFGHFMSIATDEDNLFISVTDSSNPDRSFDRSVVVIVPKCRITGGCNDDWDFVRLEDGNTFATAGLGLGVQYRDDANDTPMYLVGPLDPPAAEYTSEQTHLAIVAVYEDDGDWVMEHTTVELEDGHFNTDGNAAAPSSTTVDLTASACLHAVDVGGDALFTALHCRPTNTSGHIVRWYEIDLNGWPISNQPPSLVQQGEVNKLAQSIECYYPSLAVNAAKDVAVTWTQSGASHFMQMWRGTRCGADGLETLGDKELMKACETVLDTVQPDYSGTTVDPSNADTFYGHSTIVDDGSSPVGWETWVAKYIVSCSTLRGPCYADCDSGTGLSTLDIFDFLCFQNRYDAGDPYACECDTGTGKGVCDVFDFLCFQNSYAAGCP